MIKIPDSDALIEQLIKEAEEENSPQLENSRLAVPLNTAYRNVASSIAIISTLPSKQRKDAAIKLVDISEAAFRAIEKTLRRDGTEDSDLLQQVHQILKKIESLDKSLSSLPVTEAVDYTQDLDSENKWGHNESGMPDPLDSDTLVDTVEPVAIRILKNNAGVGPEAGEGDPAKEEDVAPPEGSEGTDQTVDDTGENELIATLAAETDKAQEGEAVPPQFKALEKSQTDESLIHTNPSHNLQLLDLLMKADF